MIARDDIIGMRGLTEAEVDAISEHEHVPVVAAAALGAYLMHRRDGRETVIRMIRDDLRDAIRREDRGHARELGMALKQFLAHHQAA